MLNYMKNLCINVNLTQNVNFYHYLQKIRDFLVFGDVTVTSSYDVTKRKNLLLNHKQALNFHNFP